MSIQEMHSEEDKISKDNYVIKVSKMGHNQFIVWFLFMCFTDKMRIPQSGTSHIHASW